ncbi:MAG: SRPBCC family protein [Candidatus Kariarchaeaceae archaeon]|jgi:ligand-binding SRPBCC domain-containing protein
MKIRTIHRETWVNRPQNEVFDFFANPDNLLKVTPDTIPVTVLNKEPIVMQEGTVVYLKMRLFGFMPVKWETRIDEWSPPDYFTDTQPKGPYRYWKHTHSFVPKDGGTLIVDHVEYAVPGFFLEPLVHALAVKRNLDHLFDYRQQQYPLLLNQTSESENA